MIMSEFSCFCVSFFFKYAEYPQKHASPRSRHCQNALHRSDSEVSQGHLDLCQCTAMLPASHLETELAGPVKPRRSLMMALRFLLVP